MWMDEKRLTYSQSFIRNEMYYVKDGQEPGWLIPITFIVTLGFCYWLFFTGILNFVFVLLGRSGWSFLWFFYSVQAVQSMYIVYVHREVTF